MLHNIIEARFAKRTNIGLTMTVVLSLGLLSGCSSLPTIASSKAKLATVTQRIHPQSTSLDRLVFVLQTGQGDTQRSHLVMSLLDGSQAKVLASVKGLIFSLSASQDGKRLIYTQQSGKTYPLIYQFDLTKRLATVISPTTANNFGGSLSFDGTKLLYSSSVVDNPEIYLADIDNAGTVSHETRLTLDPSADIAPVWLPQDSGFLFTSDRLGENKPQVYRYDLATGRTSQLTQRGEYNAVARVSTQGDFISVVNGRGQGRLINLATLRSLTIDNSGTGEPINFSPNGKAIIYAQNNQIVTQPIAPVQTTDNTATNTTTNTPTMTLGDKQALSVSSVSGLDVPMQAVKLREPIWIRLQP